MTREHLKEARRTQGLTVLARSAQAAVEEEADQVEGGRYAPNREDAIRRAATRGMRPGVAFPELFAKGGPR
jgi:hypothetical protein